MKFTISNITQIPFEEAHGGSGGRQVLVKPEQLTTPYFEAMTKGYLKPGNAFDWHKHADTDEWFVVLRGIGKFYWENETVDYKVGDIITIPANSTHKIEALGDEENEFYFVRVKCK